MRKVTELTKDELKELLEQFYKYFEDGYKFERFLKSYLEKIGLEEVVVTQSSNDGGIDLTAVRKGVVDLDPSETYYIQAKRYSPDKKISPEKIRALRGSFVVGKGIFITTAGYSDKTKEEALSKDPARQIILIDGEELLLSCIDLEHGFVFKPIFSKSAMDDILDPKNNKIPDDLESENTIFNSMIEKEITENSIRASILRLPREIINKIPDDISEVKVSFNNNEPITLRIDDGRTYLGGVVNIYRKYGLLLEDTQLQEDGQLQKDKSLIPKKAFWSIDENLLIKIIIEE